MYCECVRHRSIVLKNKTDYKMPVVRKNYNWNYTDKTNTSSNDENDDNVLSEKAAALKT